MMGSSGCRGAVSLTLLLASSGCAGGRSKEVTDTTVTDSAGIVIVQNHLSAVPRCRRDSQPQLDIGAATGAGPYELYHVTGAARLSDGGIVIVNSGEGQVRYFDSSGRFIRSVGRLGEGPEEFRNAHGAWVRPGDTVWIGDTSPWRFVVLSPEGTWVREVALTPRMPHPVVGGGLLADGSSVLGEENLAALDSTGGGDYRAQPIAIVRYGPQGKLLDTVAVVPYALFKPVDPQGRQWLFPLFASAARLAVGKDRIALTQMSGDPEVLLLNDEGLLSRIVRWSTEDRRVTDADVKAEHERIQKLMTAPGVDPRAAENYRLFLDLKRGVARLFPSVSHLLLGQDGRIWVNEFARPRDSAGDRWLGLAADGRIECRLQLPPGLDVYEIGTDYVLAKQVDELGVEHVVSWEMKIPVEGVMNH